MPRLLLDPVGACTWLGAASRTPSVPYRPERSRSARSTAHSCLRTHTQRGQGSLGGLAGDPRAGRGTGDGLGLTLGSHWRFGADVLCALSSTGSTSSPATTWCHMPQPKGPVATSSPSSPRAWRSSCALQQAWPGSGFGLPAPRDDTHGRLDSSWPHCIGSTVTDNRSQKLFVRVEPADVTLNKHRQSIC